MNILFIGPYRQNDNWGWAARQYIQALRQTKHNIAIRPLYMCNNVFKTLPDKYQDFEQLEQNKCEKYDVVIQNCLPNYFTKIDGVKNIGLSFFETKYTKYSPWKQYIEMMDEMWVCSEFEKHNLIKEDNISIPVRCIPMPIGIHAINIDSFDGSNIGGTNKFTFYYIGEYIQRKNLNGLLTAFYREFKSYEDVELIAKFTSNPQQQQIISNVESLTQRLRLHKDSDMYNKVHFINGPFNLEDTEELHQTADCFVNLSHGESFCPHAMRAMCYGNSTVLNSSTGLSQLDGMYSQMCSETIIDLYKSDSEPIIIADPPIGEVYNAHNEWWPMNINTIQKDMRDVYDNKTPTTDNKRIIELNHSYKAVGKIIEEILV